MSALIQNTTTNLLQNNADAPDLAAKKLKEPPRSPLKRQSKVLAALDEFAPILMGLQEADGPENEGTTGETTAASRARGVKNYSASELKLLTSCVEQVAPIGSQGFGGVKDLYNYAAKDRNWVIQGEKPLHQQWDKV